MVQLSFRDVRLKLGSVKQESDTVVIYDGEFMSYTTFSLIQSSSMTVRNELYYISLIQSSSVTVRNELYYISLIQSSSMTVSE